MMVLTEKMENTAKEEKNTQTNRQTNKKRNGGHCSQNNKRERPFYKKRRNTVH